VIAIVAAFSAKELWAQESYCYQDTAKYINYRNGECDAGEGNGCAEASKRAIEICPRCQDPETGDWSPCPDFPSSVEGSTYGKLLHYEYIVTDKAQRKGSAIFGTAFRKGASTRL
jgi:hypothetical protein